MRARAPGKLVLSGAYAVLRGAPALVSAVDRYAYATTRVHPEFESAEVLAFLSEFPADKRPPPPHLVADSLRQTVGARSQKLGLGSSAALLCAAIAAVTADFEGRVAEPEEIFERALRAHCQAQGGGSGIDVAAATFGGTRAFSLASGIPHSSPVAIPSGLFTEVWAMPEAASTSDFVKRVFALEHSEPRNFQRWIGEQSAASAAALASAEGGDAPAFLRALEDQARALRGLGEQAGVPIVLPVIEHLRAQLPADAAWLPSGAGGGDVTLYVGVEPSPPQFRAAALEANMTLLELTLGAPGTELVDSEGSFLSEDGQKP